MFWVGQDLLSGPAKVHAVPMGNGHCGGRCRDYPLHVSRHGSGAGFSDVPVVDHDTKFTGEVFRAFAGEEHASGLAASTLGGEVDMTPFFIDRGTHPRLQLSALRHANHAAAHWHESPRPPGPIMICQWAAGHA